MKSVQVVLIRHAQSEENVSINNFVDCVAACRRCNFPTCSQLMSPCAICWTSLGLDAPLSSLGTQQIEDMEGILKREMFLDSFKPDIIVNSPLQRAKKTAEGIFPKDFRDDKKNESTTANFQDNVGVEPVRLELKCLQEATPAEHCCSSATLNARIRQFEEWIMQFNGERVVVVGHSQYFKKMLGLTELFRNCDVWQGTAMYPMSTASSLTTPPMKEVVQWQDLRLLHRTSLAEAHRFSSFNKPKDHFDNFNGSKGYSEVIQRD